MLTILNVGEDLEQENSYSLLVGRQNVTAILEDTFVVSYKTKHTLTIWSSTCVLWYLLKGVEHLCLYQNRHKDVYSSFIHNCQNLDAATMPFWRWMNKPGPYPDNGILFNTKKKWAVKSSWKDVEETNTYYRVEEANLKSSYTVWYSGKGTTMETVKR